MHPFNFEFGISFWKILISHNGNFTDRAVRDNELRNEDIEGTLDTQ